MFRLLLLAALLSAATLGPTLAGEKCNIAKQQPVQKTKRGGEIEAGYSIPCSVRQVSGLERDLVTGAERQVAAFIVRERKADNGHSSLDILVTDRFVGDMALSFLVQTQTYQGGAHEQSEYRSIVWDKERRKLVTLQDLLVDTKRETFAKLTHEVRLGLGVYDRAITGGGAPTGIAEEAEWTQAITPEAKWFGGWTLDQGSEPGHAAGITFHFDSYTIANYSAKAFVPFASIEALIKPRYRPWFGGAAMPESSLAKPEKS